MSLRCGGFSDSVRKARLLYPLTDHVDDPDAGDSGTLLPADDMTDMVAGGVDGTVGIR